MLRITGNTTCKSLIVGYFDVDKRFVAFAMGSSNVAIALKVNNIHVSDLSKIIKYKKHYKTYSTLISFQFSLVKY